MEDQELEKTENGTENMAENPNPEVHADILPEAEKTSFSKKPFGKFILSVAFVALIGISVFFLPPVLQKVVIKISSLSGTSQNEEEAMADDKAILVRSVEKLDAQLKSYIPDSYYMIINSTDNVFKLMKGKEVFREGKCSTGSYVVLEDEKKQRKYLFKTPKGRRKVLSKKTDPVWVKPNWAFIEEGLPVPAANSPSRFEEGVLGDYALVLGEGYMIHGTIWQRYLGLPVTHGCVRLNDADLEAVYKALNKGSFVYIY